MKKGEGAPSHLPFLRCRSCGVEVRAGGIVYHCGNEMDKTKKFSKQGLRWLTEGKDWAGIRPENELLEEFPQLTWSKLARQATPSLQTMLRGASESKVRRFLPYRKKAWSFSAKSLSSKQDLLKKLDGKAASFGAGKPGSPVEVGQVLDEYISVAMNNEGHWLGWAPSIRGRAYIETFGLEANCNPDGLFKETVVEMKTATALATGLLRNKMGTWLRQIAGYQLMTTEPQKVLLVIFSRESKQFTILEVGPNNVDGAKEDWEKWLKDEAVLERLEAYREHLSEEE